MTPTLDHTTEATLVANAAAGDENAWATLVGAYAARITSAARCVITLDQDAAHGTAMEAFYHAVTTFDPSRGITFGGYAYPAMKRAVAATAGSDRVISINDDALPRYISIMRSVGGDIGEAYELCRSGGAGLSAMSLMTIHRILRAEGDVSADLPVVARHVEELVPVGLVEELFALIDPHDALVMQLRFGFRGAKVDRLRYEAGFHEDAALSSRETGVVLGRSRMTVDRAVGRSLDAMREYLRDAVDAGFVR